MSAAHLGHAEATAREVKDVLALGHALGGGHLPTECARTNPQRLDSQFRILITPAVPMNDVGFHGSCEGPSREEDWTPIITIMIEPRLLLLHNRFHWLVGLRLY